VEVFDFPDSKYLVTEFVKGGDLFDAIAADTKYSETVARGMVRKATKLRTNELKIYSIVFNNP